MHAADLDPNKYPFYIIDYNLECRKQIKDAYFKGFSVLDGKMERWKMEDGWKMELPRQFRLQMKEQNATEKFRKQMVDYWSIAYRICCTLEQM